MEMDDLLFLERISSNITSNSIKIVKRPKVAKPWVKVTLELVRAHDQFGQITSCITTHMDLPFNSISN